MGFEQFSSKYLFPGWAAGRASGRTGEKTDGRTGGGTGGRTALRTCGQTGWRADVCVMMNKRKVVCTEAGEFQKTIRFDAYEPD